MDVLAIKTAIVAPTTDPTPKNGEHVGPKAPKVAQVSPNGAPGGDTRTHFFDNFPSISVLGPSGHPGGGRDPILGGLGQLFLDFGVLLARFLD